MCHETYRAWHQGVATQKRKTQEMIPHQSSVTFRISFRGRHVINLNEIMYFKKRKYSWKCDFKQPLYSRQGGRRTISTPAEQWENGWRYRNGKAGLLPSSRFPKAYKLTMDILPSTQQLFPINKLQHALRPQTSSRTSSRLRFHGVCSKCPGPSILYLTVGYHRTKWRNERPSRFNPTRRRLKVRDHICHHLEPN
jgi:hypothetical protein